MVEDIQDSDVHFESEAGHALINGFKRDTSFDCTHSQNHVLHLISHMLLSENRLVWFPLWKCKECRRFGLKSSGNLFLIFETLHDVKVSFPFVVAAKCAAALDMLLLRCIYPLPVRL